MQTLQSFPKLFFFRHNTNIKMTSTPNNTPTTGRSLDRQITTQDVVCLREAFALFDNDRKEEITTMELGKVIYFA
jgi:Ca2+-binding EF-hand superfamily protein